MHCGCYLYYQAFISDTVSNGRKPQAMTTSSTFDWNPATLFLDGSFLSQFALVILNQPLRNGETLDTLWDNGSLDTGGRRRRGESPFRSRCQDQKYRRSHSDDLDAIVGDLDSLLPSVRAHYASLADPTHVIHDADQESTDFGKAVSWIRARHPRCTDIVALGGLGGRVDQGLSQLHHLYLFQPGPGYELGRVFLLSGQSLTFLLKPGTHRIRVRDGGVGFFGKHVGIVPIGEPSVITTKGLEWDVENWETQFGGRMSTSNHILPDTQVVEVETTRGVLFTVALREAE
ncbi:putative thiamine pyrophosphokinase [Sodiomyces alkalinus F11]|uniref:Thiamine pyrophosphokinase n=1 Tax=Sodiomyces alkalinus (strain CBS 110278 / VKM F-3762 / F11) TaxID=1314773 RepID=A0A3N2PNL4_SODAK|nr:putative thiamine pyrophosphokinase [Sodiomyces alkalinus F11]ROT36089.1 putative thiamine pyrophosphokinase [Sodiomyces alkalinus F11]